MASLQECVKHARAIQVATNKATLFKRDCKAVARIARRIQDLLADTDATDNLPNDAVKAVTHALHEIRQLVEECSQLGLLRSIVQAGRLNARFQATTRALCGLLKSWRSLELSEDFKEEAAEVEQLCDTAEFATSKALIEPSKALQQLVEQTGLGPEKRHKEFVDLLMLSAAGRCSITVEGLREEADILCKDASKAQQEQDLALSQYSNLLAQEARALATRLAHQGAMELRHSTASPDTEDACAEGRPSFERHTIEGWLQERHRALQTTDVASNTQHDPPAPKVPRGHRNKSNNDKDNQATSKGDTPTGRPPTPGRLRSANLPQKISAMQMQLASTSKNERVVALIQLVSLVKSEPECPALIGKSGLLMSLVEQLRTGDTLLKVMSLKGLDAVASAGDVDVAVVVAASGCVQLVVNVVNTCGGQDSDLLQQGVQLVDNLAEPAAVRPLLVGCGVLPALIQLLGFPATIRPCTAKIIISVLTKLAQREQVALTMVQQYDVIGFLISYLQRAEDDFGSSVVSLLSALGQHNSVEKTLQAAAGLALGTLCKLLADDNPAVRSVALSQLASALGRTPAPEPIEVAQQSSSHLLDSFGFNLHSTLTQSGSVSPEAPFNAASGSPTDAGHPQYNKDMSRLLRSLKSRNGRRNNTDGSQTGFDSREVTASRVPSFLSNDSRTQAETSLAGVDHMLATLSLPTGSLPSDMQAMLEPHQQAVSSSQQRSSKDPARVSALYSQPIGSTPAMNSPRSMVSWTGSDPVQDTVRSYNPTPAALPLYTVQEIAESKAPKLKARKALSLNDKYRACDAESMASSLPPSVASMLSSSTGLSNPDGVQKVLQSVDAYLHEHARKRQSSEHKPKDEQHSSHRAKSVASVASQHSGGSTTSRSNSSRQRIPSATDSLSSSADSSGKTRGGFFRNLGYMLRFDATRL